MTKTLWDNYGSDPPPRSSVHFSSRTDLWETPQDLFDELDSEFGFLIDVCAIESNAKCPTYYTPAMNGLEQQWRGVCWMNPPYGRDIGRWIRKAHDSALAGCTVVALVPSRTDTRWWHNYVRRADEIRFIKGRLRFSEATASAPFPSAIVVFRPPCDRPTRRQDDQPVIRHYDRTKRISPR